MTSTATAAAQLQRRGREARALAFSSRLDIGVDVYVTSQTDETGSLLTAAVIGAEATAKKKIYISAQKFMHSRKKINFLIGCHSTENLLHFFVFIAFNSL